jgi:transposase-like protein
VTTGEVPPSGVTNLVASNCVFVLRRILKAVEVDDQIRQAAETIYQALTEAELTSVIGAHPRQRTDAPTAQRNGHRPRTITATVGGSGAEDPPLRIGSFFPSLPSAGADRTGRCSRW